MSKQTSYISTPNFELILYISQFNAYMLTTDLTLMALNPVVVFTNLPSNGKTPGQKWKY